MWAVLDHILRGSILKARGLWGDFQSKIPKENSAVIVTTDGH